MLLHAMRLPRTWLQRRSPRRSGWRVSGSRSVESGGDRRELTQIGQIGLFNKPSCRFCSDELHACRHAGGGGPSRQYDAKARQAGRRRLRARLLLSFLASAQINGRSLPGVCRTAAEASVQVAEEATAGLWATACLPCLVKWRA